MGSNLWISRERSTWGKKNYYYYHYYFYNYQYYYYFFFFFFSALSTTFLRALILWQCDKIKFHGVTPACQSRDLACTCRQRSPSAMLWTISGTESLCRVYRQSHQRSCCPDHSKIPNHQCTRRQRPRKPTAQICNCGTSRHIWQFIISSIIYYLLLLSLSLLLLLLLLLLLNRYCICAF